MPWYREGTVAVAAGQTTVTGTGTNFTLNARAGDGFVGPDGLEYELVNVVSETVIGILPPYRSATVADGDYVIKPMQGYPKELTDRVKKLIDQWGASLAGLGDVATEDIVPITKGGTGATTKEDARVELGASTVGSALFTAADAIAARQAIGATQVGSALFTAAGAAAARQAMGAGTAGSNVFTAETPTAARTALLLKSAALADILGTVSQAGGMPSGAIMETGSNANGEYVRFADGTQVCTLVARSTGAITAAIGGVYSSATLGPFSYPATFQSISAAFTSSSNETVWFGVLPAASTLYVRAFSPVSNSSTYSYRVVVIGRWF